MLNTIQETNVAHFERGDHLRVRRWAYNHHGIYVSDSRVIDFSGGRNILEKPKALVQARTLEEFEGPWGHAKEVQHPQRLLFGLVNWFEEEIPPDEVVRRAECLCQVAMTKRAYRLSASNCEHIANWCKAGVFESPQVRTFHAARVVTALPLMITASRGPRAWSRWLSRLSVILAATSFYMFLEDWYWSLPRWRRILAECDRMLKSGYQVPPQ